MAGGGQALPVLVGGLRKGRLSHTLPNQPHHLFDVEMQQCLDTYDLCSIRRGAL